MAIPMEKLSAGAERLGLPLNEGQLEQFETYYHELVVWNKRVNLTAITGYEDVQIKHFLDSLTVTLALEIPPAEGCRVLDVGTGAGLPGIPLKIVFPGMGLALLEATAKKVAFLRHILQRLQLEDTEIITGRAETAAREPALREGFDIVLSRAVAPLPALAELTLPFCHIGGRVITQKKGDISKERDKATQAIGLLGGRLRDTVRIELKGLDEGRLLVVIEKIAPTPERYPRRPGIPAKRPLGEV